MALRIRCPKCGTVQRVPAGVKPTCPKCGFAGNAAAASGTPPAQSDVAWETADAGAPPAGVDAMEAPAGEQWAQAEAWPQADAAVEQPKKKGWFGRSK